MTSARRQLVLLALVLGLTGALIEVVTRWVARPWTVAGGSMRPTISEGDRLVVDLWTFRQRPPAPGELVLFHGPSPGNALLIKRCVDIPTAAPTRPRAGYWPPGDGPPSRGIWVLGDNHERSLDSRRFGAVPLDRVVGRVVGRYWPPTAAGPVR